MSGIWMKISTLICLCYIAEMEKVVWKEVGQSITIRCRNECDQDFLNLKKGINKENGIVGIDKVTQRLIIFESMKGRVETHGAFPNVDITIKNLNRNDTGTYWCVYSSVDESFNQQTTTGDGSIQLFVTEMKEVIWREFGQSVTIQCRINSDQDFLVLKRGLNQEVDVAAIDKASKKTALHKEMKGRVQTNGEFPSVDIVIKNLDLDDSGPYWCVYSKIDYSYTQLITQGNGSVLLVVTDNDDTTLKAAKCDEPNLNMAVAVYFHITVVALLGLMLAFSILIMYKSQRLEYGTMSMDKQQRENREGDNGAKLKSEKEVSSREQRQIWILNTETE